MGLSPPRPKGVKPHRSPISEVIVYLRVHCLNKNGQIGRVNTYAREGLVFRRSATPSMRHLLTYLLLIYLNIIYKNCTQSIYMCISRCSKTAKIKLFINYKREMYALAHLNLSTASFKCLNAYMFHAYNL